MRTSTACEALTKRRCLELRYDGFTRIVEVHSVGITKDDFEIMRVWQVDGNSASGETVGWKLMRLNDARSAHVTDFPSEAPREGYRRDDPAMASIICQL
jgi:hypothetical protein